MMRHYHHHHHQARQELTIFSSSSIPALECSLNKGRERERERVSSPPSLYSSTTSMLHLAVHFTYQHSQLLCRFYVYFFPCLCFLFIDLPTCLPACRGIYTVGGVLFPPHPSKLSTAHNHTTHTSHHTLLHYIPGRRGDLPSTIIIMLL